MNQTVFMACHFVESDLSRKDFSRARGSTRFGHRPNVTFPSTIVAIFSGTKSAFRLLIYAMGSRARKRSLSAHQKQMWFFTSVCVLAIMAFTVLIFWLANAPAFPGH